MTRFAADPATVRLVVGGALVYILVAASGALASPLLPLASVWLFYSTLDLPRRRTLAFLAG
ncbi:MAG: hypothetical protein ACREKM_12940, partial [Longimicrobiales bacterium]